MELPSTLEAAHLVRRGRFREDDCLTLAAIYEQARPWPRHAPAR